VETGRLVSQGVASGQGSPYLSAMILPPVSSPRKAWSDLREFLRSRQRHQWWFAFLALAIPSFIIFEFWLVSGQRPVYRPPEVVFVKQWQQGRSDAEIKAQQAKDAPAERQARKDHAARIEAHKRRMKAVEDALN
jgi:hypothetical protein